MLEFIMVEYMTALGMTMVLLFLDSKYSRRRTVLAVYGTMVLVMAAVAVVYLTDGIRITLWIYPLLAHVPSLLLILVLSRFRGWRLVFQLLSAVLFCTMTLHGAALAFYLTGENFLVLILSCAAITAGMLLLLIRVLRPLFFQIMTELQHGWWLMCLIIAAYYIIVAYLIPGYMGSEPISTILKPAISLLMGGFYAILLFFFSSIRKEAEARNNAQLAALQLSALQSRMEAVKAVEDAVRLERHDLRHRLQTAAELVSRGETDKALDFLDSARKRLDEQKVIRWCSPPVLDAVFSSYFDQAASQGIRIDADISLPASPLPVNENELAIVLANALENAIHANLKLSPGKREIRCRMRGIPGIMLEISNPYAGAISFDSCGLPVPAQKGHGLGVQSISAFCRKNGAVCQFDCSDGRFRFRLIL